MSINQRTFSGLAMSAEQFLRTSEIPVIPNNRVLKLEADTVKRSRTGIWQWLPIIPLLFVRIQDCMRANLPPGCAVLNRPEYFRLVRPVVRSVCVSALLFAGLGFYLTGSVIGLLLGLVIGAAFPFGLVYAVQFLLPNSVGTERFLQAGLYWQDVNFHMYYENVGSIPARIRGRVELIQTLFAGRHISILVRRFAGDPLILVVINQERICFGAWNTGTELDEI